MSTDTNSIEDKNEVVVESRRLALRAALVGAIAAGMALSPKEAQAQTRTTLASLQAEVNGLNAALTALGSNVDDIGGSISSLATRIDEILSGALSVAAVHGKVQLTANPVSANTSNAGELRFQGGRFEGSNGTEWASLTPIIQARTFSSATRRVLASNVNTHILETFLFNKKSTSSSVVIMGTVSAWSTEAGSMQQGWSLNGTEVMAQGTTYTAQTHSAAIPTTASIGGVAATGQLPLIFRYFANNGSVNRPFAVYNPNPADDIRLSQTRSVYTVLEIEG